jgi:hypothetical protein
MQSRTKGRLTRTHASGWGREPGRTVPVWTTAAGEDRMGREVFLKSRTWPDVLAAVQAREGAACRFPGDAGSAWEAARE